MKEPKNYTLLIVDDEEALRNTIVFDFKRKGFNVIAAANGTEALAVLRKTRVDLVLSDIRMPAGDGVSMLEQIRADHPAIPVVIFITGFADVTTEECLKKGAAAVLSKPFDRKKLLDSVTEALSKLAS